MPTILFNVFVGKYIEQRWLIILLDCVIILLFVAVGNYLASRIYSKKERELEAQIKKQADADKYMSNYVSHLRRFREFVKILLEGNFCEIELAEVNVIELIAV